MFQNCLHLVTRRAVTEMRYNTIIIREVPIETPCHRHLEACVATVARPFGDMNMTDPPNLREPVAFNEKRINGIGEASVEPDRI